MAKPRAIGNHSGNHTQNQDISGHAPVTFKIKNTINVIKPITSKGKLKDIVRTFEFSSTLLSFMTQ